MKLTKIISIFLGVTALCGAIAPSIMIADVAIKACNDDSNAAVNANNTKKAVVTNVLPKDKDKSRQKSKCSSSKIQRWSRVLANRICAVKRVLWGDHSWYVPNVQRCFWLLSFAWLSGAGRMKEVKDPGANVKDPEELGANMSKEFNLVLAPLMDVDADVGGRREVFNAMKVAKGDGLGAYCNKNLDLMQEIQDGNVQEVLKCLVKGADPDGFLDETGDNMQTPRDIAINKKNGVILRILDDYNAMKDSNHMMIFRKDVKSEELTKLAQEYTRSSKQQSRSGVLANQQCDRGISLLSPAQLFLELVDRRQRGDRNLQE